GHLGLTHFLVEINASTTAGLANESHEGCLITRLCDVDEQIEDKLRLSHTDRLKI
ncbi:hypothetical protein JOQ06_030126, partial [Pogonophryne albipinna]